MGGDDVVVQPGSVIGGTVLPESHDEQVSLGCSMVQQAFANRVQHLEHELGGLRLGVEDQKAQATALQRKNSALEVELLESQQKAQTLCEENRDLFKQVQALRKQLMKLEGLKKKVLDSISDEGTESSVQDLDYVPGSVGSAGMTRYAVDMPPAAPAYAAEPMVPQSYGFEHSAGSGAMGASPAEAGVDGKQFFREARSRLSYEAFNDFLSNIKRLNNGAQTRDDTMREARRIFGVENQHLYKDFEHLLNRHALAP